MNYITQTVHISSYTVNATVTDMPSRVDEWVKDVRKMKTPLIVGLDCESNPHPESGKSNKTAILQLCAESKCLIIQIFDMAYIPESLRSLLSDPTVTFCGIGILQDVSKLRDDYGLIVSNAVDVEQFVKPFKSFDSDGIIDRLPPEMKQIALGILAVRKEKPAHVRMSNWEARVLTPEQIENVCIDAFAYFYVGILFLG